MKFYHIAVFVFVMSMTTSMLFDVTGLNDVSWKGGVQLNNATINSYAEKTRSATTSTSGEGIDFFTSIRLLINMGGMVLDALWSSTIGFGGFLNQVSFGYIPVQLQVMLSTLVIFLYFIGAIQFMTGRDLRGGE